MSAVTWFMYKKRLAIQLREAGGVARNFNISAGGPSPSTAVCHIAKISCGNLALQPLEKKIAWDKRYWSELTPTLITFRVPEVGKFKEISRGQSAIQFSSSAHCGHGPVKACPTACLVQLSSSLYGPPQHAAQHPEQASPKELSGEVRGQPMITRKTSRTNKAIAMSLNNVACGRFGQN
jgi:hypothetical protein